MITCVTHTRIKNFRDVESKQPQMKRRKIDSEKKNNETKPDFHSTREIVWSDNELKIIVIPKNRNSNQSALAVLA